MEWEGSFEKEEKLSPAAQDFGCKALETYALSATTIYGLLLSIVWIGFTEECIRAYSKTVTASRLY